VQRYFSNICKSESFDLCNQALTKLFTNGRGLRLATSAQEDKHSLEIVTNQRDNHAPQKFNSGTEILLGLIAKGNDPLIECAAEQYQGSFEEVKKSRSKDLDDMLSCNKSDFKEALIHENEKFSAPTKHLGQTFCPSVYSALASCLNSLKDTDYDQLKSLIYPESTSAIANVGSEVGSYKEPHFSIYKYSLLGEPIQVLPSTNNIKSYHKEKVSSLRNSDMRTMLASLPDNSVIKTKEAQGTDAEKPYTDPYYVFLKAYWAGQNVSISSLNCHKDDLTKMLPALL
jgi:hypothetical protein